MSWFSAQRDRLQQLFAEFGTTAFVIYWVIFFATWFGFWWAIGQGYDVEGASGEMSRGCGSYAATKLTQPLRIGATLLLTPFVAAIVHRMRGSEPGAGGPAEPGDL